MSNARNFYLNSGFVVEKGVSALAAKVQQDYHDRGFFVDEFLTDCIIIGTNHYANFKDADHTCLLITGDKSQWPHIKEVLEEYKE